MHLSLHIRLTSVIALIVVSSFTAAAQVHYVDIDPDTTIQAPDGHDIVRFYLDIDGDSDDDFEFRHFSPTGDPDNQAIEFYFKSGAPDYALLMIHTTQWQPSALAEGTEIGPGSTNAQWITASSGQIMGAAFLNRNDRLGEPWEDITNGYLGFAMIHGQQYRYGWMRLDVPLDASSVVIKDYAIKMTPNEPINAGEGAVSSIDDIVVPARTVEVHSIGKSLVVQFANPSSTPRQLTLYSLLGVKLGEYALTSLYHVIPMTGLTPGSYLAVVNDGAVLRSEMVLKW